MNSVVLHVEARILGTATRAKSLLVELLNSGGTVLETFTTASLTGTDAVYSSASLSTTVPGDNGAAVDGYQLRITVQEGGGMTDTATVEIDRMWVTIDYTAGASALTSTLYSDPDTFYVPIAAPGTITLSPSLHSDADTFYAAEIEAPGARVVVSWASIQFKVGAASLRPALYSDADTFYAPTASPGTVTPRR